MTWAITAAVVTVVSGAVAAKSQIEAGKQQKFDLEAQADQERIAAEGEELQRREELNRILAANIASLADSGISGEGTPESISLASAKKASTSEGLKALSTRLRTAQLRRQGRAAESAGKTQAALTLLSTASKAISAGGPSGSSAGGGGSGSN